MCNRQLCLKYRFKRELGRSPFNDGAKWCKICGDADERGIFIKWDGVYCPCCGYKLRISSRHKIKDIVHECISCQSHISLRGKSSLWFKDKEGNDVCFRCWFKIHKVVCMDCKKEGKVKIGDRSFVILSINEIRCRDCNYIRIYSKKRDKFKKLEKKPIVS